MKKILLAGLLGGIILYIWGAAAWVVIPLHKGSLHRMANEESVVAAMKTGLPVKGVYLFPGMPGGGMDTAASQAAMNAYARKYEQGPTGMVIYDPGGLSPMMTGQMIIGFIVDVLCAFLAAWLLARSTAAGAGYVARVCFCGLLGILITLFGDVGRWNWMNFPLDYTTAVAADTVIAWVLAGLGIGWLIKIPKT